MPTTVIEDRLAQWVALVPGVIQNAGGRVYPFGEVPQGTAWPFVTYYRVSGSRLRHLKGPAGVSHPMIQIGCHAKTYKQARTLADALRVAMDDFGRGDMGGLFVQSMITGPDRDYGPKDEDLDPPHGDVRAQCCVSFDVTIWFEEGA